MESSKLIWLVEKIPADTFTDSATANRELYYIKIVDRNSYGSLAELWLDESLYIIFQKIMKFDRYSLQYIEHNSLGEAAKIKLRQSPHHKIKSLEDLEDELTDNEKEFYLGP